MGGRRRRATSAGRAAARTARPIRLPRNGYGVPGAGRLRVNARLAGRRGAVQRPRSLPDGEISATALIAIAQFRPFARHGFFIKGGYGMALVKGVCAGRIRGRVARTWGMGVMYGAGWVFDVGRRVSLRADGRHLRDDGRRHLGRTGHGRERRDQLVVRRRRRDVPVTMTAATVAAGPPRSWL